MDVQLNQHIDLKDQINQLMNKKILKQIKLNAHVQENLTMKQEN